jgi:hypothetical protein
MDLVVCVKHLEYKAISGFRRKARQTHQMPRLP